MRSDPPLLDGDAGEESGTSGPCSATCSLCDEVTGREREALKAIGCHRSVRRGEVVTITGDANRFCASLTGGVLQLHRADRAGRQTVSILFPGDLVGDLYGAQASDTVVALTDAQMCFYRRSALERLTESHPLIGRALLRRALHSLADARRWLLVLRRSGAQERVAAFLIELTRRLPSLPTHPDTFELPAGRGGIGEMLGLSLETISRQFHALARAGLIALPGRRYVQLLDRKGLEKVAGAGRQMMLGATG
jgi:CRP/FNR family transcriptional regulator